MENRFLPSKTCITSNARACLLIESFSQEKKLQQTFPDSNHRFHSEFSRRLVQFVKLPCTLRYINVWQKYIYIYGHARQYGFPLNSPVMAYYARHQIAMYRKWYHANFVFIAELRNRQGFCYKTLIYHKALKGGLGIVCAMPAF